MCETCHDLPAREYLRVFKREGMSEKRWNQAIEEALNRYRHELATEFAENGDMETARKIEPQEMWEGQLLYIDPNTEC
jgi:hypothetical protein